MVFAIVQRDYFPPSGHDDPGACADGMGCHGRGLVDGKGEWLWAEGGCVGADARSSLGMGWICRG